jgi:hypothetical protein
VPSVLSGYKPRMQHQATSRKIFDNLILQLLR